MSVLVEASIKATALVLFALLLMPLLRRRSAALRHWILTAAMISVGVAPLVQVLAPSWFVPIALTSHSTGARSPLAPQTTVQIDLPDSRDVPIETAVTSNRLSIDRVVLSIWLLGVVIALGVLLTGLFRLARLVSRSDRLSSGRWAQCALEIGRDYGLRRQVIMLRSPDPTLPITWGYWQPKLLLPAGADEWRDDRLRLVVCHELAHVRRGDWIVHLGAELLRAVYWFNPLIWMLSRRLRQESEQACDDLVLNRGVDAADYAAHLVDIVKRFRPGRFLAPAPAIVRPSSFERRVAVMLNPHVNRRPLGRFVRIVALIASLAAAIPIATVVAGQAGFVTLSGSIVDPTNAVLPAVKLVLTNLETNEKREVQSNREGRYEFGGLSRGTYRLDAELPGFTRVSGAVMITNQNVQQDFTMQIGSLQETVSVVAGPNEPAAQPDLELERRAAEKVKQRQATPCPGAPSLPGAVPIGGNLRVPLKVKHAAPQYPASLIGTVSQGMVVLNGRIGTDGAFDELNVLVSTHPDFAAAAIEAVQQWRFDPTVLNCVPVATPMKITVNFAYHP